MNTQIITTVEALDKLALLICAIDTAMNNDVAGARLILTEAHITIEEMLGEHAHLVYWPDDEQVAA